MTELWVMSPIIAGTGVFLLAYSFCVGVSRGSVDSAAGALLHGSIWMCWALLPGWLSLVIRDKLALLYGTSLETVRAAHMETPADADAIMWISLTSLPFIVALYLIIEVVSDARCEKHDKGSREKETQKKEPTRSEHWQDIEATLNQILESYTAVECDPRTILDAPLILDTLHLPTAQFHTALSTARAAVERHTDADYAHEAVDRLQEKWIAAYNDASRTGVPTLNLRQRRRGYKLLDRILDSATTDAERQASRAQLDDLLVPALSYRVRVSSGNSLDKALALAGVSHKSLPAPTPAF